MATAKKIDAVTIEIKPVERQLWLVVRLGN